MPTSPEIGDTGSQIGIVEVFKELKANPDKEYLMLICGPYTCLLSSSNEITYLFRREGSADLPFESGVDYYSKLYNEKLAFSYSTFFQ